MLYVILATSFEEGFPTRQGQMEVPSLGGPGVGNSMQSDRIDFAGARRLSELYLIIYASLSR